MIATREPEAPEVMARLARDRVEADVRRNYQKYRAKWWRDKERST